MKQIGASRRRPFTAYRSARDIAGLVAARQAGAEEVARAVLSDIADIDPLLNGFAALDTDRMIGDAAHLDRRLTETPAVPLARLGGVPVPVKDLISTRAYATSFGSVPMAGNRTGIDAPSVARILAQDAILCGKTTTSELGCKATGYSPLTGTTRNPWKLDLTPGGSSAGSAAVVAAGIVPVALGTDGGGSVRIPAALTGIFGIKPTFGRVPVYPVSATPSLGHVGVLSRDVRDAALVLDVIAGVDRRDPYSVPALALSCLAACDGPPGALRVAYSPTLGYARPDAEIVALVDEGVRVLETLGCDVTVLDRLFADPAEIWESEFYTDVAAKVGGSAGALDARLDPDVARKLEAYWRRDVRTHRALFFERLRLRETVDQLFERFDLLVTPTLPTVAFPTERTAPPGYPDDALVTWSSYTYPFNLTGHPAASLPVGFSTSGLPVGLQIVADRFGEESLFAIGSAFERARPWAQCLPPLTRDIR